MKINNPNKVKFPIEANNKDEFISIKNKLIGLGFKITWSEDPTSFNFPWFIKEYGIGSNHVGYYHYIKLN